MSKYREMIGRVLGHEGGYLSPEQALKNRDPGGETNWGISKRSFPNVDIKNLTRDGAIAIYKEEFWDAVHGDELPPGFAYQALDAAVNSGVGRSIMWMQKAAGVADDGDWGPRTREAVQKCGEADLVLRFLAYRLDFMTRLANWPNASKGWARRIAGNMLYAAQDNDQ